MTKQIKRLDFYNNMKESTRKQVWILENEVFFRETQTDTQAVCLNWTSKFPKEDIVQVCLSWIPDLDFYTLILVITKQNHEGSQIHDR